MFFVCVTVGLVFFVSKYRDNVLRGVQNLCQGIITSTTCPSDKIQDENINNINNENNIILYKNPEYKLNKIILADSLDSSDHAVQHLYCNLTNSILGFDCEWVNNGPVTLLQLATDNGVCALFRIGKIGFVPPKLKELLSNKSILKIGVEPFEDGKKLTRDYGCRVFGTLDLRTFAEYMSLPSCQGLSALSLKYLGVELNKKEQIRCSNWDAEYLNEEQKLYAACDALVACLIYQQMNEKINQRRTIFNRLVVFIKSTYIKKSQYNYFSHNVPLGLIDVKYSKSSSSSSASLKSNNNAIENTPHKYQLKRVLSESKSNVSLTRKDVLYENCYLKAPDGETLCSCDRKKAEWYIAKGLAVKVNDDPFTVRLNFEPSARCRGDIGEYYTQIRLNQCVVCGSQDKFIKKNIIPREYRKYFPIVMKSHQSHDCLLLCPTCHDTSNRQDLIFKRHLAITCNAPLSPSSSSPTTQSKNNQQRSKRNYQNAVKVLNEKYNFLPQQRREELEQQINEYNNHQNELSINESSDKSSTHGQKVVEYFKHTDGGLVSLEKQWREHFLNTMEPQYLPPLWSVDHNQRRLERRITENRIEPEDAKIAGIIT
ncbi:hypothetical protein HCN44_004511 [Aphidius gifuensis]|uniref:3'-5' exonuclease domain-containing protein n=1 Tax=Aphidius gifuensis TaxID=684658 RepID=A0A835CSI9_APHGI|nr:exonuclease 3'-5' domain-containing protein 2-like [Aphidius gifuensis]KAF7995039.1 hypothetical protein HCN44_004511 [Aphidius gifuensis]